MSSAEVIYRDWRPSENVAEITALLHSAYGPLAQMGFNYTATDQDDATTLKRLLRGRSMLAVLEGRIVGTITLDEPRASDMCPWYREYPSFQQFAVLPSLQKRGIGSELLRRTEERAKMAGAKELAFDTAEGATDLCRWYAGKGYRLVQHVAWKGKTYRSVVMSKTLAKG